MATQKFFKGLLYKKKVNPDGEVVSRTPFLLKTLASLVFTKKGQNVDQALDEVDSTFEIERHRSACKEYPSLDAYKADLAAGKVSTDEIVYIPDTWD